jgi:hypothetical protein
MKSLISSQVLSIFEVTKCSGKLVTFQFTQISTDRDVVAAQQAVIAAYIEALHRKIQKRHPSQTKPSQAVIGFNVFHMPITSSAAQRKQYPKEK